jgi:N-glycosylase/DNA lyase
MTAVITPIQTHEIENKAGKFSSDFTFDSGQVFRWRKVENAWIGVIGSDVIKIADGRISLLGSSSGKNFTEMIGRYFSLDDDFDEIYSSFPRDDQFLQSAVSEFEGLRLVTQDPWECLISFVCSIDCNIPSIRLKIENLSMKFGKRIYTGLDDRFYSFPEPAMVSHADKRELLTCKLGFRWKYVKFIAREVHRGALDLEQIWNMTYILGTNELISKVSGKTFGVGPKVADCALLYAYHRKEAFPLDVWLLKYVRKIYGDNFSLSSGLSRKKYFEIGDFFRKKFGPNAGYAQLFLYEKIRHGGLLSAIQSKGPA